MRYKFERSGDAQEREGLNGSFPKFRKEDPSRDARPSHDQAFEGVRRSAEETGHLMMARQDAPALPQQAGQGGRGIYDHDGAWAESDGPPTQCSEDSKVGTVIHHARWNRVGE